MTAKSKGPTRFHEFRQAIDKTKGSPPQYVMTVEVVVRDDQHLEDHDCALDDIRCYGSAEIISCEPLPAGDPRRL